MLPLNERLEKVGMAWTGKCVPVHGTSYQCNASLFACKDTRNRDSRIARALGVGVFTVVIGLVTAGILKSATRGVIGPCRCRPDGS